MALAANLTEGTQDSGGLAMTAEMWEAIRAQALGAGFDLCGVAGVGAGDEAEAGDRERFAQWVDAGYAGEMEYLKRRDASGELLRGDVGLSMPWARSVIVCAVRYGGDAPRSIDAAPTGAGWIARYAWSGRRDERGKLLPADYHDELLSRLRRVEEELKRSVECTTRCYVDTGPLLERGLAARAGIGWIGKNTCVINEELGSWLLLGVIVTSLTVGQSTELDERVVLAEVATDRCGSCTRCIDACPTDALRGSGKDGAARAMDASRCIAYLTIEKKGAIDTELRDAIGRQVFGCDICQDVCPWNARMVRRGRAAEPTTMPVREELINPALEWLAGMESSEFKRMFRGSPLERTGKKRLRRNVAIAMGNSGDAEYVNQLETWRRARDEGTPDDPVLREAAEWAMAKIARGDWQR